ncbi:MAG: HAD family hydrolase, partial [Acidimicrobiales bacterium]
GWRAVTGADLPLPDSTAIRNRHRPAAAAVDDDDAPPKRQLELLVLDAFGVLFDADDDITTVLGPFVTENGGTDDAIEVAERYRQASLGRLSAAEFWSSLRVEGDPEHLDHEFVARLPLTDGALTFLERAKLQGLTVACLANGLSRWFDLLRRRDSLDVYCETWLISSDIGVRKPDPAAYEALQAATGVPLTNCLMIDDRVEHLEAARRVGMSTALFGSRSAEGTSHPHLDTFESLLS